VIRDFFFAKLQHFLRGVGDLKQRSGGAVDAFVGGLGGENHGDQQRIGVGVLQLRLWIRADVGEAGVEFFRFGFGQALGHVLSSLGSRSGGANLSA